MKHTATAILAAALMLTAGAAFSADDQIVGAPGVIPHPIDSYLPISVDKNACLMCHKVAAGEKRNPGQIPVSHATNGKVNGDRWNCTLYHAPSVSPEAKGQ